ncbi:MAG: O-antigen ligase family protein [Alphaproteobacteria bacterium]|nr:O-antigen ligase family protein [Alphaproteobacteria bacterium]
MNPRALLFWLLMAIVALAPLPFGSNRPWSWSLLGVLVGLLVLFWVAAAYRDRTLIQIEWRRSRIIVVPFAVLMLWFLLQASGLTPDAWHHPLWEKAAGVLGVPLTGAISLNPEASKMAVMRLLAYGGIFWLAFQLGRNEEHAQRVFWVVAITGLVYAIYGLVAHLSGSQKILWYPKWAYEESLTSTFINRNNFATYAGITLITTLALLVAEIRRILRYSPIAASHFLGFLDACGFRFYLLIVACGTIFTALLLSHSRGGFLSALVGIGAFMVVSGMRLRSREPVLNFLPAAIGGTLALGMIVAILLVSGKQTFTRIDEALSTGGDRLAIYERTAEAIGDFPMVGTGIGAFKESFRLYRDADFRFSVETIDRAHNTYLELALEGGLPALILMVLLLAYLTLLCFLGTLRRGRSAIYPAVGVATTALVATHAMVDFSIQVPAVAATYLLLLGVGTAQSWSQRAYPAAPV